MKKLLAILMVLALAFCTFAACSKDEDSSTTTKPDAANSATPSDSENTVDPAQTDLSQIKIGLICLHDENSTYDNNFIEAMKEVKQELGLSDDQVLIKTNIGETNDCYETAAQLADAGCNIIFADSFGHEPFMIQAAEEFPEVQFCHATGTQAHVKNLANFHNAFASIYEGRYLAGVAAGMKLKAMIDAGEIKKEEAKIGYVGAYPYAEVKSGYTSFFLGARSICESATMEVIYTNSWFDIAKEREAALNLINNGCKLISQHADSEGAPKACEEKNIPNVAYNISTIPLGPNTALISSKINWAPYYKLAIAAVAAGQSFATDYCGTIASGSVQLTELNDKVAAPGTKEKLEEVKAKIESGEIKVFDTKNWTKDGKALTEYEADVDGDYKPDTNVIIDGVFVESGSQFRSAPYFDIIIDGIKADK